MFFNDYFKVYKNDTNATTNDTTNAKEKFDTVLENINETVVKSDKYIRSSNDYLSNSDLWKFKFNQVMNELQDSVYMYDKITNVQKVYIIDIYDEYKFRRDIQVFCENIIPTVLFCLVLHCIFKPK